MSDKTNNGTTNSGTTYEVEARVAFADDNEAYSRLPFLKDCLKDELHWTTWMFSARLFKADRMLRFSDVVTSSGLKYYIGLKEPDVGRFCNIRIEVDEDITDGLQDSAILNTLGIDLNGGTINRQNIFQIFGSYGFDQLVEFHGHSLVGKGKGKGRGLDLSFKLMHCSELKYPLMLEFEKTAYSRQEASQLEKEIEQFADDHNLKNILVRTEPPALITGFPV